MDALARRSQQQHLWIRHWQKWRPHWNSQWEPRTEKDSHCPFIIPALFLSDSGCCFVLITLSLSDSLFNLPSHSHPLTLNSHRKMQFIGCLQWLIPSTFLRNKHFCLQRWKHVHESFTRKWELLNNMRRHISLYQHVLKDMTSGWRLSSCACWEPLRTSTYPHIILQLAFIYHTHVCETEIEFIGSHLTYGIASGISRGIEPSYGKSILQHISEKTGSDYVLRIEGEQKRGENL
jgi:hypothetical protein